MELESKALIPNSKALMPNRNAEDTSYREKHGNADKMMIGGYPIEVVSIAGHETCVILPSLKLAFNSMGYFPGLPVHLSRSHGSCRRGGDVCCEPWIVSLKPPTIVVPKCVKEDVERLFEVHRKMDHSELKNSLISLDVDHTTYAMQEKKSLSEETNHVILSQGYIVYSVREKLKKVYIGLPGTFTGDTILDFIIDEDNADVLKSKILIMESTFIDDKVTTEHAREYVHTHISEIVGYADRFDNQAILLIHFSARHK